jgi:hypothetical protein
MAEPSNSKPERAEAAPKGRWQPGVSGNPAGRPAGARHETLRLLDAIGREAASDVLKRVVELAKGGDIRAADILLRRVWPEGKGRPLDLDLPAVKSAADIVQALGTITAATAAGTITVDEAQAFAGVLEQQRRSIELVEMETRIAALEARGGAS